MTLILSSIAVAVILISLIAMPMILGRPSLTNSNSFTGSDGTKLLNCDWSGPCDVPTHRHVSDWRYEEGAPLGPLNHPLDF